MDWSMPVRLMYPSINNHGVWSEQKKAELEKWYPGVPIVDVLWDVQELTSSFALEWFFDPYVRDAVMHWLHPAAKKSITDNLEFFIRELMRANNFKLPTHHTMEPVPKPVYCLEGYRSHELWGVSTFYFRTYEEAEAHIPAFLSKFNKILQCRVVRVYPRDPVETHIS